MMNAAKENKQEKEPAVTITRMITMLQNVTVTKGRHGHVQVNKDKQNQYIRTKKIGIDTSLHTFIVFTQN